MTKEGKMKIKVCGMRKAQNIEELIKLAPEYMGFIFYEKSKRHVSGFPKVNIPNSIKKVGVFVNESVENITEIINKNRLDVVQLHGDETPEFCIELKRHSEISARSAGGVSESHRSIKIIKAFSVDEHFNFESTKSFESCCDVFIFDTKGKNYGGNGIKYDWNILKNYTGKTPFLLSGGIQSTDVDLIKEFNHESCIGLDLNSGFEDEPALKNIEKLKEFIEELKK